MSSQIYVIATIEVKHGSERIILEALEKLALQSREEAGCIQYDPYVDTTDNKLLFVYEIWRDQQALDEHANSSHFIGFIKTAKGHLSSPLDVKVINRII